MWCTVARWLLHKSGLPIGVGREPGYIQYTNHRLDIDRYAPRSEPNDLPLLYCIRNTYHFLPMEDDIELVA